MKVLNNDSTRFLVDLHKRFEAGRKLVLAARRPIDPTGFITDPSIRDAEWRVAQPAPGLVDRRVEITGPCDRKMMINALNSGAQVFMADLEDSLSPTWENILNGHQNLYDAVRKELRFESAGKSYSLNEETATLVVRPRGWHLVEKHFLVDRCPISASLFDFGLFLFNNAHETINRGYGPYFYLPKLESHIEAQLWNEVFKWSQDRLGIPQGTIRATVLIETYPAAFQMEEILFELKEHSAGLNAGRWDYLFSVIKKSVYTDLVLPDRSLLTMDTPFLDNYAKLLVQICHKRGAHAIGGMSAYIPSRKDEEVNRVAYAQVRSDKVRESGIGFDGTWVAHPDLVPIAKKVFDETLREQPHQISRTLPGNYDADCLRPESDHRISQAGVIQNINVALRYLSSWLDGQGAVSINNLMEDAATAEISRAQLWQWLKQRVRTVEGIPLTVDHFQQLLDIEHQKIKCPLRVRDLLSGLVLTPDFPEFLTTIAYNLLGD